MLQLYQCKAQLKSNLARSWEKAGSHHLEAVLTEEARHNLQESLDRQHEELERLQADNSKLLKQHDSDSWSYKWSEGRFEEASKSLQENRDSLKGQK